MFKLRNYIGRTKYLEICEKSLKKLIGFESTQLHDDNTVTLLDKEFRLHSHLHKAPLKPKKPHVIKYDQDITLNYAYIISGGQSESKRRSH